MVSYSSLCGHRGRSAIHIRIYVWLVCGSDGLASGGPRGTGGRWGAHGGAEGPCGSQGRASGGRRAEVLTKTFKIQICIDALLFNSRMQLAKGFFLPFRLQIEMPRTAVQARVGVLRASCGGSHKDF